MKSKGLSIRLLGELAVEADGTPVPLPASKKTRALLGYLVATRAKQSRQRLCDLLWDGPDDPRAALRWSLTKLRPLVDGRDARRLAADREHVAFELHGAAVDLFEARAHTGADPTAATTEALRLAARGLSGDFLEGLDLPDCYRFHEWCRAERERVRALRLGVLDALVSRLGGAPDEALDYARQRIAIDPLADVAHAMVVRLLARLGRHAEAIAQVDTCRHILDRELGGRRSPALELARLEIGKNAPTSASPPAPSPSPATATATATAAAAPSPPPRPAPAGPLVARAVERGALAALVDDPSNARVVVLSGEPGIGKSRLLRELGPLVAACRGTLLSGRAFEGESVRPFGVWVDMLRGTPLEGLEPELRRHLAPLFPELGETSSDAESRARLFDGVLRLLRELPAPVVIAIDDLHWLDDASSGLLHYVARVSAGSHVTIVCATREGELEDNQAALRVVRALRREGKLLSLPLAPLDESDTRALVATAVGESIDCARVFRESGGNPLYVIEVARALATGAQPRALDALLGDRLSRLDPRARDLVVWAAALGREVDPALLARVSGETLGHVTAALGDLERDGIVVSNEERFAFAHDLVRTAAYRSVSGARRRLLHLAIARTLAAGDDPGEAWGDVVHHATLADDAALAVRACVQAGKRSLRMLARESAKDFATRGLVEVARRGLDGLADRAELLEIAALSASMDPKRQVTFEESAEDVLRIAREQERPDVAAKALYALSFFRSARGDFEGAREVTLGAAEAARATSPAQSVPTIANTAFCLTLIERELPKARALLDEAAEGARLHRLSVIDLDLGEGYLAHFEGDAPRARRALERALASSRSRGDPYRQSMALIRLAMTELEAEDWQSASARAAELRAVATKLGDGSEGAIAGALEGLATPGADLSGPLEGLARADSKAMLAYCLTMAADRAAEASAWSEARALAARALDAAVPLGKPSAILLAHATLARAATSLGEDPAAHLVAAEALASHPYGLSKRAQDALDSLSNGATNGPIHGAVARRRKKR